MQDSRGGGLLPAQPLGGHSSTLPAATAAAAAAVQQQQQERQWCQQKGYQQQLIKTWITFRNLVEFKQIASLLRLLHQPSTSNDTGQDSMLRLCHVCASKCISWALAGTAYAAGHKTEMRLSASFEVLSDLVPLRSDHVLSGVASTILDGEVSTVTSLSLNLHLMQTGNPLGLNQSGLLVCCSCCMTLTSS